MKPGTRFELVMWAAFALFYTCAGATVCCVLFAADLRFTAAGILASFGAFIGAMHAREIHVDNKIGRSRGNDASAAMDGNGWD